MKREIIALLLLIALFGLSVLNIGKIDGLIDGISGEIAESYELIDRGEQDAALEKLNSALNVWIEADSYTHVFLRHPEIDSATDAFYELQEMLISGETEGCEAAYAKLLYHLDSMRAMEHFEIGSIF